MQTKPKLLTGIMTLFVLGELFVFGFILLLQFVSAKENLFGFIMTLIGMHVGIVFFILSKRLYKVGREFKKHYIVEYIMLACFLPMLFLKIFDVEINRTVKLTIVYVLTGIAVVVSIINDIILARKLKRKEDQNGQNINEEHSNC